VHGVWCRYQPAVRVLVPGSMNGTVQMILILLLAAVLIASVK
jgi:hypothetical protein